jgi:hypothetical protein
MYYKILNKYLVLKDVLYYQLNLYSNSKAIYKISIIIFDLVFIFFVYIFCSIVNYQNMILLLSLIFKIKLKLKWRKEETLINCNRNKIKDFILQGLKQS